MKVSVYMATDKQVQYILQLQENVGYNDYSYSDIKAFDNDDVTLVIDALKSASLAKRHTKTTDIQVDYVIGLQKRIGELYYTRPQIEQMNNGEITEVIQFLKSQDLKMKEEQEIRNIGRAIAHKQRHTKEDDMGW